ncbi:MAG: zinc ribbon domain-containing protein [Ruminococcus sp.]|nr:zinc ribbon domain-containing protein [Ruminococcus sp.]
MICPKCGKTNQDDSAFCNICGTKLAPKVAPKPVNFGQQTQAAQPAYQQPPVQPQYQQPPIQPQYQQAPPQYQQPPYQQYQQPPVQPQYQQDYPQYQQDYPIPQMSDDTVSPFGGLVQPALAGGDIPGGKVKVRKKSPKKLIFLLIGIAVLIAAVVFLLIFLLKKPGDTIMKGVGKTLKSENMKMTLRVDYDFDGIAEIIGADMSDLDEGLREYGVDSSNVYTYAELCKKGSGDKMVLWGQFAYLVQARMDRNGIEVGYGNRSMSSMSDSFGEYRTQYYDLYDKDEYSYIFDIVSSGDLDDMLKKVSDIREIDEDLREVVHDYDKLPKALAELLNDTKADYVDSYKKGLNSFTYEIDVRKFLTALIDSNTLNIDREYRSEIIDELYDIDRYNIKVKLTVKLSGGKLDKVTIDASAKGVHLGKATLSFSYGSLKDSDLQVREFDQEVLDPILVPSMMGYVKKSRLHTANGNAKTAYVAVAVVMVDAETAGIPIDLDYAAGEYQGSYADGPNYDIAGAIEEALSDNGTEAGKVYVGKTYINGNETFFVQWTNDGEVIGQYPQAIISTDSDVVWGVFYDDYYYDY